MGGFGLDPVLREDEQKKQCVVLREADQEGEVWGFVVHLYCFLSYLELHTHCQEDEEEKEEKKNYRAGGEMAEGFTVSIPFFPSPLGNWIILHSFW